MLKTIFSTIIEISIVTSIIITILAILSAFITKRYAAKWRCIIWAVILLRLIVPINITLPTAPIVLPEPPKQEVIINRIEKQEIQSIPTPQATNQEQSIYTLSPAESSKEEIIPTQSQPVSIWIDKILIAAYIWIFGMLAISVYYIIKRVRFQRFLKMNTTKIEQKRFLNILMQLGNEIGITRKITPVLCRELSSPMVIGLMKPMILLPQLNYCERDLQAIVRHELIHIKKNHLWFKFGMLICEIIYWFNPFVYLLTRFAQSDMEYACDSAVLKLKGESYKEEYSRSILSVIENTIWNQNKKILVLSTGFSEEKNVLKKRFQNIFDEKNKKKGFVIIVALILVIGISGSFLVFGKKDVKQVNDSLTIYKHIGQYDDHEISGSNSGYNRNSMVNNYKREYPDINVNLKEFDCSPEEFIATLNTEFQAGNGPDVIVIDFHVQKYQDVYKMMQLGVFAQLDDFVSSDKDINMNDYYKPIMDAGVLRNKRYVIPLQFHIPMFVSGKQALEDSGISIDNCNKDYLGFSKEMYQYYANDKDDRIRFTYHDLLPEIEYMGIRGAYDYQRGSIKFNTPAFKKAMEEYQALYQYSELQDPYEYFTAGKQLRDKMSLFSYDYSPQTLLYDVQSINGVDDSVIIPMRTTDGGIEATISTAAAIRNNSNNKQNAYNYIKLMMKPSSIVDYYGQGFTINKKYNESYIKSVRGINEGLDEDGIYVFSIHKESYDELSLLLEQVNGAHFYSPLTRLLEKSMKPFLKGQKSYEECIKNAEDQLKIYISE